MSDLPPPPPISERPPNPIHMEYYDRRMDFVKSTMRDVIHLTSTSIETVEFIDWIPFAFNNYIFLVTVEPASAYQNAYSAYTAMPIPEGTTKLIMRLPNPDPRTDLNNANRVANEVAAMHLIRNSVKGSKYSHIVPNVYGWEEGDGKVGGEQGWILMEYKEGVNLTETRPWDTMQPEERNKVLGQMADIWTLMRSIPVPQDGFGGLKFDDKGDVELGQLTLCEGGPYKTYTEYMKAEFAAKMKDVDAKPAIGGWKEGGLRERIDKYLEEGLGRDIIALSLHGTKVYTHADFSRSRVTPVGLSKRSWLIAAIANAHFNPESLEIVAMFDYDFGYVSLAYDDYLMSLSTMNYRFPALFDQAPPSEGNAVELQRYMLERFPEDLGDDVDLQVAAAWHQMLRDRGTQLPADLPNMKELAEIRWFLDNLAPFYLVVETLMKRMGPEKVAAKKNAQWENLDKWLRKRGF